MRRAGSRTTNNSLAKFIDFIKTVGNVAPTQMALGVELMPDAKVVIQSV